MNTRRLWLYRLLTRCLPESRGFGWKNLLLRLAGARIGRNVRIYSSARILGNGELEIGDDVHIGPGALISSVAPARVTIGRHVDIAPEVMVLTGSHEVDLAGDHVAGQGTAASVVLGPGSWLGARATIMPGVTLAEKTLVAAGAVVSRPVAEPCGLVAGVPAVWKKSLKRQ